jgi:hypothetical protein
MSKLVYIQMNGINNTTSIVTNSSQLNNFNFTMTNQKEHYFVVFYFLPVIIFGVLTNLINIIIFSNKKFKDKTFTYLLYHSISEFLHLSLNCVSVIPYCGNYCSDSLTKSLLSKLILLCIDSYFTSCLAIFAIFIETTISFQRYLVVSNSTFCGVIKNGSPHKISIILFIISIFYYLPELIFHRINHSTLSSDVYDLVLTNNIYSYFSYLAIIIRGPICTLLLTIISFLTLFKFRKQMEKKKIIKFKTSKEFIYFSYNF